MLMNLSRSAALAAVCLVALGAAPAARAGLFDDDEARRAILDLRQKLEQSNERQRALQAEQITRLSDQITQNQAQFNEQIATLKRSLLDLNSQLELLRADTAKLRGQDEQRAREVAELQLRQKDLQSGVDDRMRKLEPQRVTVDGKEFLADPDEKRQYDDAIDALRKGEFERAASALVAFRKRYPASGYAASAWFWLGNAQYGARQYKEAIASFRALVNAAPDHPKAPEALLSIANCQAELKDSKSARRTLDELLRLYPKSEAAQAGRDRLAALK